MRKVYNRITRMAGDVITVEAEDVGYGDLALVGRGQGASLAQVIRLNGREVSLQVLAGTAGVSTWDEVRFLGRSMEVSFSDALLGRIFNGSGRPRDRGPVLADHLVEVDTPPVNPAVRVMPSRMIRTGIPMIDLFNSLVESQKISIFTAAGEPAKELLARIALQAGTEVVVLGGMGLRYEDYLYFRDILEKEGMMARTVMFAHTAADPVVECLLVPDLALAVAERFALKGRKVLALLTDMTNYCDALKEIAIIMEQVPSNRGYPGDLYSRLAARYEKAVDFKGAGSVTILSVTTMPGNDVTHPVPDNTGYITEGQYYLHNGRIEPFGSLSRLKQYVNKDTREDHRPLMDGLIQLYASYQETLEKKAMGFKMSGWDRKLLAYGEMFERELMDLTVNITLEEALDRGWKVLRSCFTPEETGFRTDLIKKFWDRKEDTGPSQVQYNYQV